MWNKKPSLAFSPLHRIGLARKAMKNEERKFLKMQKI